MIPAPLRPFLLKVVACASLFIVGTATALGTCVTFTVVVEHDDKCVNFTLFGVTYENIIYKLLNNSIIWTDRFKKNLQTYGLGSCGHPTTSSTVTECWPEFSGVREFQCFPTPAPNCTRWDQFVQSKAANCGFFSCSCIDTIPDEFVWDHACTPQSCRSEQWYWNYSDNSCNEEEENCGSYCFPYYPLEAGGCASAVDYCAWEWGCDFGFTDGGSGCCCGPTPILIDTDGNRFDLTDAYHGINFDLGGVGRRPPVAWTAANSSASFLVLDRNNDGQIDSGKELFGNFTDQAHAATPPNGFLALAEFDQTEHGGNNNGKIDSGDSVFSSLRLWQDGNHNGISEGSELRSLADVGIVSLDLDYRLSKRLDRYGNEFRYRAKVGFANGAQRFAWDVILKVNPPPQP